MPLTSILPLCVHSIPRLNDAQLLAFRDRLSTDEKLAFQRHIETRPAVVDEFADDDVVDTLERRAWAELSRQLRAANQELSRREHDRAMDEHDRR